MRNSPAKNSIVCVASPPARHKGLTLIELLVAISVLAFIAVLGWRGLDSIVRARIVLNSDLEQTRGMQLAFAQMQSDCAHLASAATLQNRMPLLVEHGRLTLVRMVFADDQPSRLQVITYRVMDGVLTRHESIATRDLTELDTLWLAAVNNTDANQASFDKAFSPERSRRVRAGVVLQSGVAALTMRIWAGGGWRAGVDALPPAMPVGMNASPLVPTGLEVALQLQGGENSLLKIFLLGAV